MTDVNTKKSGSTTKVDTVTDDKGEKVATGGGVPVQQLAFLIGLVINFTILYTFPELDAESRDKLIRFPQNGDDLRLMHSVLEEYSESHFAHVALAYVSIYINF